jgi:hyaluronoglucosaminidase
MAAPYVALWNSPFPLGCPAAAQPTWNASWTSEFHIETNYKNASFNGPAIATFYEFGLYPMFDTRGCAAGDWNCSSAEVINGGLPQAVDMQAHLQAAQKDIEALLPDPLWNGVASIDWENWWPSWRMNGYDEYQIYQNRSIERVRAQHPGWALAKLTEQARRDWEGGARALFLESLALAKKLRPHGVWGWYNYAHCSSSCASFGAAGGRRCSGEAWNDELTWLYDQTTALFPSIYLIYGNATATTNTTIAMNREYVDCQLSEAKRVARAAATRTSKAEQPIYAYAWEDYYCLYNDSLRQADAESEFLRPAEWGVAGVLLWGSSNDVATAGQCRAIGPYIQSTLGPTVKRAVDAATRCSAVRCSSHGRCVNASLAVGMTDEDGLRLAERSPGRRPELDLETRGGSGALPIDAEAGSCACYPGWTGTACSHTKI